MIYPGRKSHISSPIENGDVQLPSDLTPRSWSNGRMKSLWPCSNSPGSMASAAMVTGQMFLHVSPVGIAAVPGPIGQGHSHHSQCASAFTNLITPGGKSNWVEDKLSPSPELYQHLGPSFFGGRVLFRFRMDQLLNSCWLYMIIGGCYIQYIYILDIIMDFRSTDSFSDVQIGYWDSDPHPYPALLWRRGHKTDISSRFFQVGSTAQLSGSDSWLTSEDWQASHAGISPVIYV